MQMIDGSAFCYLLFVLTFWCGSFYYGCGSRKLKNTLQALLSALGKVNPKAGQKKLCYRLETHRPHLQFLFSLPLACWMAMALWKQFLMRNLSSSGYRVKGANSRADFLCCWLSLIISACSFSNVIQVISISAERSWICCPILSFLNLFFFLPK